MSMSGLVLDIEGSNKERGAKVCLWSKNQPVSGNQQFDFAMPVSSSFLIGQVSNNTCVKGLPSAYIKISLPLLYPLPYPLVSPQLLY